MIYLSTVYRSRSISTILLYTELPVVPARGGAEVALGIYKTFLIYRTCMRRAPAKPVRACILRKWCPVSHVTFEAPLRTSHFSLHSSHSTLRTSHSTLHTSQSTLHTALFTLHTSSHLSSSHLIPAHLFSSLLISSLLICHLSFHESLPSTATKELACAVRQPGPCVCALCEALQYCCPRTWPARDLCAMQRQANIFLTLHIALHTSHLHFISTHLTWALLISFHVFPHVSYLSIYLPIYLSIYPSIYLSR